MRIEVIKSKCEHLKDSSVYGNNFYKLPFQVNGYDVVREHYDHGDEFDNISLGIFITAGTFMDLFYLNEEDAEDVFIFDSDSFSNEHKRT